MSNYFFFSSILLYLTSSLPSLPNRFFSVVEANIINKNKSTVIYEFYDYNASKAKIIQLNENQVTTTFDDFADGKDRKWTYKQYDNNAFDIIPGSCKLVQYSLTSSFSNQQDKSGHLSSSSTWFQFGSEYEETLLPGNYIIREIPAEAYFRSTNISTIQFPMQPFGMITYEYQYNTTYFFSKKNSWSFFGSDINSNEQILLRLTLVGYSKKILPNGTVFDDHTYNHNYEYVSFKSGKNAFDDIALEWMPGNWYSDCDVSEYCAGVFSNSTLCSDARGPDIPKLENQYSSFFEMNLITGENKLFPGITPNMTIYGESYYDYDNNRVHNIFYYDNKADHQLDLVDRNQSWYWTTYDSMFYDGDGDDDSNDDHHHIYTNCKMVPITKKDGYDGSVEIENGHLANIYDWFRFNDSNRHKTHSQEMWMGYQTVRGMKSNEWHSKWNDSVTQTYEGQTYKYTYNGDIYNYFSSESWKLEHQLNMTQIPLRGKLTGSYSVYNQTNSGSFVKWGDDEQVDAQFEIFGYEPMINEEWYELPHVWAENCNIDENYCKHNNDDICNEPKKYPELPNMWSVTMEVNFIRTNLSNNDTLKETWVVNEENDNITGLIHRNIIYDGYTYDIYEDPKNDKYWTIKRSTNNESNIISCDLQSHTNKKRVMRLSESSDYLITQFAPSHNKTHMPGYYDTRGIVSHWYHQHATTYYEFGVNFIDTENDYYFSTNNWMISGNSNLEIPLLMSAKGQYKDTHNNIYNVKYINNFFNFQVGNSSFEEDDVKFDYNHWYSKCNVTHYCQHNSNDVVCLESKGPPIPQLPYNCTMTFEQHTNNTLTYYDMYYDYYGNRAHVIYHGTGDFIDDASHQLEFFNSKQRWFWTGSNDENHNEIIGRHVRHAHDHEYRDCSLTKSDQSNTDRDFFIRKYNNHIAPPSKWFLFNDINNNRIPIWNGYDIVRGIPAEKWVETIEEDTIFNAQGYNFRAVSNYIAYIYFSRIGYTITGSNTSNNVIPLRYQVNGEYSLYSYNSNSGSYDTLIETKKFDSNFDITKYIVGVPDDEYFELPFHYREKCNISVAYCNEYPSQTVCQTGPTLPTWPTEFSTNIEASFIASNYSMNVKEAYSKSTNRHLFRFYPVSTRGSLWYGSSTMDSTSTKSYLEIDETIWIFTDDKKMCELNRLKDYTNGPPFTHTLFSQTENVVDSSLIYFWHGNKSDIQYVGNDIIRGIPVNRWDIEIGFNSVVNDLNISATGVASYYFMQQEYNRMYPNYNIPVRIEVIGHGKENIISTKQIIIDEKFDSIYDFVNFIPGIPDGNYFVPPSNQICKTSQYCADKQLPSQTTKYKEYYQDLLFVCDDMDTNTGNSMTNCYYNTSCTDIYESLEFADNCEPEHKRCDKVVAKPWEWVLFVLFFFIGLCIAVIYHKRANRAIIQQGNELQNVDDNEAKHAEMTNIGDTHGGNATIDVNTKGNKSVDTPVGDHHEEHGFTGGNDEDVL